MSAATYSWRATVGEIAEKQLAQGNEPPGFFVELIDQKTAKCYGIEIVGYKDAIKVPDRFVGAYGARIRAFRAPFEVKRGHRMARVFASVKKPVICTEHIYPLI